MIIDAAGYTNVGLVRSTNQDSILIRAEKNRGFFIVADGMGGHSGGDYASQSTIKHLASWWDNGAADRIDDFESLVRECGQEIVNISNYIYDQFTSAHLVGGSTIVALIVSDDKFATLTVGDSHIYRSVDKKIVTISEDDVWENQDSVRETMTPEQISSDSRLGKLTAAIGAIENVKVHAQIYNQLEEEFIVLCTDGIYKLCSEEEFDVGFGIGLQNSSAKETIEALSTYVWNKGANDNFTIAVCRMRQPDHYVKVNSVKQPDYACEAGANCDIQIADDIYEDTISTSDSESNIADEEPSNEESSNEEIDTADEKTPEEEKPTILDKIKLVAQDNKIALYVLAVILVVVLLAIFIAKCSTKKNPVDEPSETTSISVETTIETTETTVAETTEETLPPVSFENTSLIMVSDQDDIINSTIGSSCNYFGDFDGDGERDGVQLSFCSVGNGNELVLTWLDTDGRPIYDSEIRLDDILMQYIEMDVVGLLPITEESQRTALFASVVNNDGKDYIIVYYSDNGTSGNKTVVILSRDGVGFTLENMYTNIDGVQQLMYPVTEFGVDLSYVDQMCQQSLGMDFVNIGEDQLSSGEWNMGTQVVGLVYTVE